MRIRLYGKKILPLIVGLLVFGLAAGLSFARTQTKKSHRAAPARPSAKARAISQPHARTTSLKRKRYYRRSRKPRGQRAPTADRISEIQTALAKDGSYAGAPNGKWDSTTAEAMKKFQAGHGLNPSGKLDALTLQKLGLGAPTAGIAAPYPPNGTADASNQSQSGSTDSTRKE